MYRVVIMLLILPMFLNGISIKEAENLALKNNRDLLMANESVEESLASYGDVKGSLYPQVKLSGSYGVTAISLADINKDLQSDKETALATSLDMSQLLFSADVFNGLKAARIYKDINSTNYEITREEVLYQTRRLYNSVLLLEEVVTIQEEALRIARERYSQTEVMFEQGLVSEYDKLRSELQVSQLIPALKEAENNSSLAMISLENYIGWKAQGRELEGSLLLPIMPQIELQQAINEGLSQRLELESTKLNSDILNVQYQNEKRSYLPSLSLSGSIANVYNAGDYSIEGDEFNTRFNIALGFQMPIFTGFSNRNKMKKFEHQWKSAVVSEEKLQSDITLEITSNYKNLEKDRANLVTAEKNRFLATKGLVIAEKRYSNQLGTYLDVQESQLTYSEAQVTYISAVYNVVESFEALLKSMGRSFQ
ncbi:MAG: hypothetical protein B6226_03860 [Candidatus Cloacimonetes bacterium 4572_65]|nr:MAG: hypothetical protein B6226_03860 [Candidatus Cloacimonetes bacterium 4572_65]